MSDVNVPVKEITVPVIHHPNADKLSIVKIEGYLCIQAKNPDGSHLYNKGDKIVYIPEGYIVPDWILKKINCWKEDDNKGILAGPGGNIVKAKKLRGTFSQGLLFPVEKNHIVLENGEKIKVHTNMDVSEILGIKKFEAPIPKTMSGDHCNLQKYTMRFDFENIQSRPTLFDDGEEVYATEKLHGCVDSETIIETIEFGSMKIKDLIGKEGCHVKAFDTQTNEIVFELLEGTRVLPNNNNWFEIELENGKTIKLTGNHPIWIPSLQCYRRVDELNGDEEVFFKE